MASIGPAPIKEERDEDLFARNTPQHLPGQPNMAQQGFNQFGGGMNGHGSAIDPNDLMNGAYNNGFSGNGFNSNAFPRGSAALADDDLMDSLGSPTEQMPQNNAQDFGGNMNDMNMNFAQGMYGAQGNSVQVEQGQMNGYSNTPDGDPIQSPFVHSFGAQQPSQMRQMGNFGTSLQSPISYSGSPMASEMEARARLSQSMQRRTSATRSPLTATANPIPGIQETGALGAQPIRSGGHQDHSPNQQWVHTPNSMASFPGSGFPSPMQAGRHSAQISDMLMQQAGTSMPAKLNSGNNAVSSQEMKRKRRRESHNLVERRRRDNINERIQDLSKLVPNHRLEDEKIRKLIQSGTPLSPTLTGASASSQATSGLAGPGARRATSGGAGNITTGLPVEDKDKGPNKGDILNGAVSWTRDLMWMLKRKLEQQEELMNYIAEIGGHFPIEFTDDEKRMQSELLDAFDKSSGELGAYSRTAGTGLRVPHHTDHRGEPLNDSGNSSTHQLESGISVSPDNNGTDLTNEFWHDADDDVGNPTPLTFKEEDEFGMDLGP